MANNPREHLYLRLDGNNRPIAGSGVYRKTMPKNGQWVDVTLCAAKCCSFSELVASNYTLALPATLTYTGDVISLMGASTTPPNTLYVVPVTSTADSITITISSTGSVSVSVASGVAAHTNSVNVTFFDNSGNQTTKTFTVNYTPSS